MTDHRLIHRVLRTRASARRIWQALTDPAQLGRWLCELAMFRPEKGAPFRFEWGGGHHADGQVVEFEPERSLVLSYRVPAFEQCLRSPTSVQFELAADHSGDGCEVSLWHRDFLSHRDWDGYYEGHRQCWDVDLQGLLSLVEDDCDGPEILRIEFELAGELAPLVEALDLGNSAIDVTTAGVRITRYLEGVRTILLLEPGGRVILTESRPRGEIDEAAAYRALQARLTGLSRDDRFDLGSPYG